MSDKRLVTGLFRSRVAAESAARELRATGYRQEDMTVLMSDATREKEFGIESGTKAAQGAAVGGAVGGTTGVVLATIAAVGTATGGLVGLLVGSGIPEHRAKVYEAGLREGSILMGVEAGSDKDAKAVENLFDSLGALDVRQE